VDVVAFGQQLPAITIPPRKSLKLDDVVPSAKIQSANPVMVHLIPQVPLSNVGICQQGLQIEERPTDERKPRDPSPDSPDSLFSDHPSPDVATQETSTAVAGSSSKTNVPVKGGSRTKPKQRLVKLFEPENLKDSSFLSTKQKLIQRVFTTAAPKLPEPTKTLHDLKKSLPSSSSKELEAMTQGDPQPVLVQDDPVDAITALPIAGSLVEPFALCPSPAEYLPLANYDPDPFASFEPPAEPQYADAVRDGIRFLTVGTGPHLSCVLRTYQSLRPKTLIAF
jgi:hypothetical protein